MTSNHMSDFSMKSKFEPLTARKKREIDPSNENGLQTTDYVSTKNNQNDVNDPDQTVSNDQPTKIPTLIKDSVIPKKQGIMDDFVGDTEEDAPKAFNLYRNKKLLSQGLMDIALFSANASQLRYVIDSNNLTAISYICMALLIVSIILQILVGIALVLSTRYNVINCNQRKMAFRYGNYVVIGIFLITAVNVFIAAFGGPSLSAVSVPAQIPVIQGTDKV